MQQNALATRRSISNLTVLMAVSKFKDLRFRHVENKNRKQTENAGRRLKLSGRSVCPIPLEIFSSFEIEILDLSTERVTCLDFRLKCLPHEIGCLYRLRVLNLDVNALKSLPDEISELRNLECLTVSCNKLRTLPLSYRKLTRLESLHLASNLFQAFPFVICHMEKLTFLDLSCNQIDVLPLSISKLTCLRTLLLFNNRIREWPDALCDLTELRTLWLGKNELRCLPIRFGQLQHLDWEIDSLSSNIGDNPLLNPPLYVCKMGIHAIRDFLQTSLLKKTSSV